VEYGGTAFDLARYSGYERERSIVFDGAAQHLREQAKRVDTALRRMPDPGFILLDAQADGHGYARMARALLAHAETSAAEARELAGARRDAWQEAFAPPPGER